MSSYNNVQKIKYTKNPSDVVALQEYIVFEDTSSKEKYIVFKFINNLNQTLRAFKFEVMQFDENNELVEKSVVLYDKFSAASNSPFVPNAKLKVNFSCKSITVNLIAAFFDRVKWVNGIIVDNSYKFDHYSDSLDASRTPAVNPAAAAVAAPATYAGLSKQQLKIQKKQQKQQLSEQKKFKKKNKNGFGIKNIFRKNRAVFPKVFNVLACVLVVAFAVSTLVYFTKTTSRMNIDGYDLEISDDGVNVIGYDGFDKEVVIPSHFNEREVKKISKQAFKDSTVSTIKFETENTVVIEEEAFSGCKELKIVSAAENAGSLTVMQNAFANCTSLEIVNIPAATVYNNAFYDCAAIKQLSYGRLINARMRLAELFGKQLPSLEKLTLNSDSLPSDFFNGITVREVKFTNENLSADYGAFKELGLNNYVLNEYCEVLNGQIVTVNVADGTFAIPQGVNSFSPEKFSQLKGVKNLKIKATSGLKLDESFFKNFASVTSLEVANAGMLESKCLSTLASLESLTLTDISLPVAEYLGERKISYLTVNGTRAVSSDTFAGLERLEELKIADTVSGVAADAFRGLSVTKLCVPYYGYAYTQADGVLSVSLTPYKDNTALIAEAFSQMGVLQEITLEEGFVKCGRNLVKGHGFLRKISFPPSLTSYSVPAIGEGCTSLTDVKVSFLSGANAPSYYEFNRSSEYTSKLSVEFLRGSVSASFFAGANALKELYLSCSALDTKCSGFLEGLSLEYLQIKANAISATLNSMFSGEATVGTAVIDCTALPDGFFTGMYIGRLLLINIASVNARTFGDGAMDGVYFTQSLDYNVAFLNVLKNISAKNFYFKGNKPQDVTLLDENKYYSWNYDVESIILTF